MFDPQESPEQVQESPKTDIRELAVKHGQVAAVTHDGDPYKLAHMMAAMLHGWNREQYHVGVVELTDDDYLKALAAAETGETHAPANRRPS